MNRNIDDTITYIKKIFEREGYKFTTQKLLIIKTILDSEIHLSAKEIYTKLRKDNIGMATVYRSLRVFKELGVVKEININNTGYYEMKIFSKNPFHIHFKCFKCNNIIDINSKDINIDCLELNNKVEIENNLEIYDLNVMFIGLCSDCKEELKWQDRQKLEK